MYSPARRAALPAVLLTALCVILLAVMLNAGSGFTRQTIPPALYVALGVGYVVIALLAAGAQLARAALVLLAMLATQAVMALFTGLAYASASGGAFNASTAFLYALSGYLPGLLLQSAVVFLMAPVAATWWGGTEADERRWRISRLPDLRGALNLHEALDKACRAPEVAGVALCDAGRTWGGGIWQRDPQAACLRVRSLMLDTSKASALFVLGGSAIFVASHRERIIAVSLTDASHDYIGERVAASLHRMAARFIEPPTEPEREADDD